MLVSRIARAVSTSDGKTVLEVAGHPFFQLNAVAAEIWAKLSEGFSIQQIISAVVTGFCVPEGLANGETEVFIESLKRHHLLIEDASIPWKCHTELIWNKGIAAMCDWRVPDEFPAGGGYWSVPDLWGNTVPPNLLDNLISDPAVYLNILDRDLVWVKLSW